MKIKCPKCRTGIRIGDTSRYDYFTCKCGYYFCGIEADVAHLDFVVGQFIGWSDAYSWPNRTPCFHCGELIWLTPHAGGGYDGPSRCSHCTGKLPQRGHTFSGYPQKVSDPDPAPYIPPVYVPPLPSAPKAAVKPKVVVDPDVKTDKEGRKYKLDSIGRPYYNLDPNGIKIDETGRPYKLDSMGRRYYSNLDD